MRPHWPQRRARPVPASPCQFLLNTRQASLGKLEACCHGALVGFDTKVPAARRVLAAWLDCAMHRECIAPVGSHRGNHRQVKKGVHAIVILP